MSIIRTRIANEVTAAFLAAEVASEVSAAEKARCIAMMIEARRRGRFGPGAGREALRLVHESANLAF